MGRKRITKKGESSYWLKKKSNSRTTKIYGGCKVYSPSGNLMFLCVEKKARWYLNKNDEVTGEPLAVEIRNINSFLNFIMQIFSINPKNLRVQLQFEPKEEGNKGDKYSLSKKNNKCVVTGNNDLSKLTKHHVTPYCYRAFMPEEYKSANSHDIVPIISDKHYEYEREADKLKLVIAKKYDAPLEGQTKINHSLFYAIKSAQALKNHGDKMPKASSDQHKKNIREYSGQKKVAQKLIEKLVDTNFDEAKRMKSHGEIVVEKLVLEGDVAIQEFVEIWRRHFIQYAKPKYMPKYWDIKRPASRKIPSKI